MRATHRDRRAQSAMEYLITYSWLIVIVVVVLAALFQLGVFNPNTFAPRAQPGACNVYRPYGPGTISLISLTGICTGEWPKYVTQFNGANSFVEVPDSPLLNPSTITISAWIKLNVISPNLCPIVDRGTYYGGYVLVLNGASYSNPSNPQLIWGFGVGSTSTSSVKLNTWSQVVVSEDGSNTIFYVNGVSDSKAGLTMNNIGSLTTRFGMERWAYSGQYLNGMLANIQIYNKTLSASEIKSLYVEGIGGAPIVLQNLVGWWPLNGDTNDYSGNNNNGVPSNVAFTSVWTNGYLTS
jgi:hypothetical protein